MPSPQASRRARSAAAVALDSRAAQALRRSADRFEVQARARRFSREVSLSMAAVLLVGVGAASAQPSSTAPAAAPVAAPSAPPEPARSAPQSLAAPTTTSLLGGHAPELSTPARTAPVAKPRPKPAGRGKAKPAAKVDRWLPTGTGMWLHDWRRSERGHAPKVIIRAKQVGLSHLYVQTGSTRKGWIGEEVLSQLMPATKGTDIKVIAWDFPKLIDPEADARRLARAAWWNRKGAPMVAAVAPDVETSAEGTRLSTERVRRYYAELRRRLPARTAILATVPWPSEKRTGMYPYAATAPYSDAFVPMAYWYNRSPSVVTKTSMQWLKRFGKPVMPVGQGYDGRLDAPYLKPDPHPDKSVARFVYVAREQGAQSVSLWSWQTTGSLQWGVLKRAAGTVGPRPAPKPKPKPAGVVPTPSPTPAVTGEDVAEGHDGRAEGKAPGRTHDRRPKDAKKD